MLVGPVNDGKCIEHGTLTLSEFGPEFARWKITTRVAYEVAEANPDQDEGDMLHSMRCSPSRVLFQIRLVIGEPPGPVGRENLRAPAMRDFAGGELPNELRRRDRSALNDTDRGGRGRN
jgi:hypothetical protein